jgi:hypothetical protein
MKYLIARLEEGNYEDAGSAFLKKRGFPQQYGLTAARAFKALVEIRRRGPVKSNDRHFKYHELAALSKAGLLDWDGLKGENKVSRNGEKAIDNAKRDAKKLGDAEVNYVVLGKW